MWNVDASSSKSASSTHHNPYFSSISKPQKGYWEPHTATIDFCESNYLYTPYITEIWNSVSSIFGIVLPALLIFAYGIPKQLSSQYARYGILALTLGVVGVGSTLFHAALIRPFQALDEIPMVLQSVSLIYCLKNEKYTREKALPYIVLTVFLTAIYIIFEMYIVFFASYALLVVYLAAMTIWRIMSFDHFASTDGKKPRRSAELKPLDMDVSLDENGLPMAFSAGALNAANFSSSEESSQGKKDFRFLIILAFSLYFTGVGLWIAETLYCSVLEPLHFHVFWHFLAGIGSYYYVVGLGVLHLGGAYGGKKRKYRLRTSRYCPLYRVELEPAEDHAKNKEN